MYNQKFRLLFGITVFMLYVHGVKFKKYYSFKHNKGKG